MHSSKGFVIRVLFLICLAFSVFATYYSTITLQEYEVLMNDNGLPDLEITYD
jgi:hypothetical protein